MLCRGASVSASLCSAALTWYLLRCFCIASDRTPVRVYHDTPGVLLHMPSYKEYVEAQKRGNAKKLHHQWVERVDIKMLAHWLRWNIRVKHRFGICHGTRSGREQRWFRKFLRWGNGTIIGTEIAETARQFSDTVQWDFHRVKEDWISSADFIYSNALDHSFDPKLAITQWMRCLGPNGVLLLEHSRWNARAPRYDSGDYYSGTFSDYLKLILSINGTEIIDVLHARPSPYGIPKPSRYIIASWRGRNL